MAMYNEALKANSGFQDQKKSQAYNKAVIDAKEAAKAKEKFFGGVKTGTPYYKNSTSISKSKAHPATLFDNRFDRNVGFEYKHNNVNVYGQKGMNMYKMPQYAFDDAMQFVDPHKIEINTALDEAIKGGIVDYHKKNEWAYADPKIKYTANMPKSTLSVREKMLYYDNERRRVKNPYDVETSNRIKNNRRLNEIMPKQRQQLKDYSELYHYNHLNDGKPFFDGNQYKYKYGMKPVWGAKNQGKFDHKIDKNTVEYEGDPNYPIRKLEEQRRKYWANRDVAYGKANKFNPKDIYEGMVPYYDDDVASMYNKQFKPGVGDKFNIQKEKNINYFRGDFNDTTEHGENYYKKRNDNEKVFWKDNYAQRQFMGMNGKANYLFNDGRFLVEAQDKKNRPYWVFAADQHNYQGEKHIDVNPYASLYTIEEETSKNNKAAQQIVNRLERRDMFK